MVHIAIPANFTQDAFILGAVSIVGYVIKAVFKPTKIEAMLLARILVGIVLVILNLFRRWQKDHTEHIDGMISDAVVLKNKLKRNKIVLG